MNLKQSVTEFALRALRLVGVLVLIYVCMVFYLALTERQNAYPRAIAHKEAEAAIQSTAKPVSCTLEDGIVLGGWTLGDGETTFLYYPDADEDAAQFLAEVQNIKNVTIVTFNYRGSANNKGTPNSETFLPDSRQIAECATQVKGVRPQYIAGRGTGAILAAEQFEENQKLILIDPVESIADALSEKYRALYPKFLVRAPEKVPTSKLQQRGKSVFTLSDRVQYNNRTDKFIKNAGLKNQISRGSKNLQEALTNLTQQTN